MKLVGLVLAKDEAGKFLQPVLTRLLEVCEAVLLLDDHSTDDTRAVAKGLGCVVKKRTKPAMWGQESSARQELWEWGVSRCKGDQDWLLICDADQILVGDPRPLMRSWESNTVVMRLYDLWSPTEYRCDTFWQGHTVPRPWMVAPHRVPTDWVAEWNPRGIHCGHLPLNWPVIAPIHDPTIFWNHLAYSTADLRQAKHAQYLEHADKLSSFEAAHAASILDS